MSDGIIVIGLITLASAAAIVAWPRLYLAIGMVVVALALAYVAVWSAMQPMLRAGRSDALLAPMLIVVPYAIIVFGARALGL